MNWDNIWKLTPTKTEVAAAIPPERVHALTTSTQFPNDELGSSRNPLEPDARPYRKRGYFSRSSRGVLDRLKAAAIEIALIAILLAGFIIMAALIAVEELR
jgi:hypothetical protein